MLECPAISLDTVGFGYIDRCCCQLLIIMFERMADVNANLLFLWQMFLPLLFMSDGIGMRPDVMALIFVTDVVVTCVFV